MPNDFVTAMAEGQQYFDELVKPHLEIILGGKITVIEGVDNDIARELDRTAGIDAWLHHNVGLVGIAIRIQYGILYETFTIRQRRESGTKTEYEKRNNAVETGALTPKLTVQAYVDRKSYTLLGGAIARTEDIFICIKEGKYRLLTTGREQIGQAAFYAVKWSDVAALKPGRSWCPTFGMTPISNN